MYTERRPVCQELMSEERMTVWSGYHSRHRGGIQPLGHSLRLRGQIPGLGLPGKTVNGLFSKTTCVSQYQKGETNLDFNEARHNGEGVALAGPYANNLHLAPGS